MPFEVEIKSSGVVVPVGAEESMLEALEAAEIEVPNLCRGGVCGQCVCQVEEGEIEHRDHFLSGAEKAAGTAVMPCVSRAKSKRLVIEI
jgi:ferredoxin